jgi:hypothetical protein
MGFLSSLWAFTHDGSRSFFVGSVTFSPRNFYFYLLFFIIIFLASKAVQVLIYIYIYKSPCLFIFHSPQG